MTVNHTIFVSAIDASAVTAYLQKNKIKFDKGNSITLPAYYRYDLVIDDTTFEKIISVLRKNRIKFNLQENGMKKSTTEQKLRRIIRSEIRKIKESITGEVVFSTNGSDNSIIKVTELPNGVIQVYKDGNRTNWKAVQDLVNPKDRKEISRYILNGESIMKEESNSPYKQKVFKFLDHPWQEDIEIEIIGLISEYRKAFLTGKDSTIRSYLKRLVEKNNMLSGSYVAMLSDRFVDALEELIK